MKDWRRIIKGPRQIINSPKQMEKERKQIEREHQELKAKVARLKQTEAELQALEVPEAFAAEVASLRAKLKLPKAVEEVEQGFKALQQKIAKYRKVEAQLQDLEAPEAFAAEVASLRAKLKLAQAVEEVEQELRTLQEKVAQYRQAEALRQAEARAREAISSAQATLEEARNFGCTLDQPDILLSQALSALESREYPKAIEHAESALHQARITREHSLPRITLELNPKDFRLGQEGTADITVANQGRAHAREISLAFSPEMEIVGVTDITQLNSDSQETLKVRCTPKEAGYVSLTATITYKDMAGKEYKEESTFWLTVTPEEIIKPLPKLPGYTLTSKLGSGAFGEVYKAERKKDGLVVAVKIPKLDVFETFQPKEFLQEAELWSRLKHPYIVLVQEWGAKPFPWIAVELMTGGSLYDKLRDRLTRLTLIESLGIGVKLCEALDYTHHLGVIHRDIKPQNILFDSQDTPKLSDWGLGKVMLETSRSVSGFKGTLAYSAPEQLTSDFGEPDWRTDIFQLGAVLYEMFTGKQPGGGELAWILTRDITPPCQLNPNLPAELDSILLKALARKKEMRHRDVFLLGEELEKVRKQVGDK